MRRLFLISMLILMLLAGTSLVQAHTANEYDKVEVAIWPEYDRPSVLVIYRMTLPAATALPAELTVSIPAAVGQPFNVANREDDGKLYTLQYTSKVEGEWLKVTFTTPTPEVQLEYYDEALQISGAQRHFSFRWAGDPLVQLMTVSVQQPLNASNMVVSDFDGQILTGGDGLNYYVSNLGKLEAGTAFEVTVDYDNPSGGLSAGSQPLQPVEQVTPQTKGRVTFTDALPWIIGALGVMLLGVGGLWYYNQKRTQPAIRKVRKRQSSAAAKDEPEELESVYCHQCGKRSKPGDSFCRACGSQLRHD